MRQDGERASHGCFINHVITWEIATEFPRGTARNGVEPGPELCPPRGEGAGVFIKPQLAVIHWEWLRVEGIPWHFQPAVPVARENSSVKEM